LEKSPINKQKGQHYDELVDDFYRLSMIAKGSERPFNEITNSIKWDAANGSNADKAPFSI
jgi:hypothetical protein